MKGYRKWLDTGSDEVISKGTPVVVFRWACLRLWHAASFGGVAVNKSGGQVRRRSVICSSQMIPNTLSTEIHAPGSPAAGTARILIEKQLATPQDFPMRKQRSPEGKFIRSARSFNLAPCSSKLKQQQQECHTAPQVACVAPALPITA